LMWFCNAIATTSLADTQGYLGDIRREEETLGEGISLLLTHQI